MKWGHDQLANDLAASLRGITDRMVWTDMQLGSSGSPRPDVFTAPKSYSKFMPIAYEVKISVSDYRSDVTSGKWQSYLKYASGVTFAVPAGLITKADLPKGCGLMIRGENGWTTVKAPTLSPMHDFPREAMIKLLIDGIDRAKHPTPKERMINPYRVADELRKKYGDSVAEALSRRDRAASNFDYQCAQNKARFEAEQARYQTERQKLKESMAQEATEIDAVRANLCKVLGLSADADAWEIKHAATKAVNALNKDHEISRMQEAIKNMKWQLERAIENINKETPALLTETTGE